MKREVKDTDASTCPPSVRTARRFGSNAIAKECVEQAAVAVVSAGAAATEAEPAAAAAAAASTTRTRAMCRMVLPLGSAGREARRGPDGDPAGRGRRGRAATALRPRRDPDPADGGRERPAAAGRRSGARAARARRPDPGDELVH